MSVPVPKYILSTICYLFIYLFIVKSYKFLPYIPVTVFKRSTSLKIAATRDTDFTLIRKL